MKKQTVIKEFSQVDTLTSGSYEDILGFKQLKLEEQRAKLALNNIDLRYISTTYTLLIQSFGYKVIK